MSVREILKLFIVAFKNSLRILAKALCMASGMTMDDYSNVVFDQTRAVEALFPLQESKTKRTK